MVRGIAMLTYKSTLIDLLQSLVWKDVGIRTKISGSG